jgi:hypothetical protein
MTLLQNGTAEGAITPREQQSGSASLELLIEEF